jgi:fructose PTS system EIIBC or EIIC component
VAVTACPTGIAHTYMAAEVLEAAAERAGVDIAVETQGSAGSTPLPHDTIANADAVIFAVDVGVRDRGRLAGKPLVSSTVKRPVDDGDAMIAEALRFADDPSARAWRAPAQAAREPRPPAPVVAATRAGAGGSAAC